MFSPITKDVEINRRERSVRKGGKAVHLTGLEYGLLDYLTLHPNRICTRDAILDHVWGERFQYDTGTIDVHLNALRRKLDWSRKEPIETVRGIGFIFRIEQSMAHYTVDLQQFLTEWLRSHETDVRAQGLDCQVQLTPFVNELTIAPENLRKMLDSILTALLPGAPGGSLRLTSKLTMQHFILSLDINGATGELRIPIYGDSSVS